MLYAIVSDIHANESAFRRVLADAKSRGAESFVCLGDTVGYGPLPENAANLARGTCGVVLAGNHDDAVAGRIDSANFIGLASDAVRRHREALSKSSLDWLRTLPHTYAGDGFLATHGDFTDPKSFNYVENEKDARANFAATDARLMFVGHTHEPELYLTGASGKVYRMGPTDFAVEPGKRYIVNPGSVGYPREKGGRCESSYVLYDSTRREVTFHTLPFSVSSVMQRGTSKPEKRRRGPVAALVLALAALFGAAAFLTIETLGKNNVGRAGVSSPAAEGEEMPSLPGRVRESADLVIKSRTVTLSPELRKFLPNLRLANGSAPVILQIRFLDQSRQTLFSDSLTVRKSRTKAYDIPRGTALAEISLLKLSAADRPDIAEYTPAFKP